MNIKSLSVYIVGGLLTVLLIWGLLKVGDMVTSLEDSYDEVLVENIESSDSQTESEQDSELADDNNLQEDITEVEQALQLTCSTPAFDVKNRTYTVKLTATNVTGASLKYEILNENHGLVQSTTSTTVTLAPTENGVYYAKVSATKGSDVQTAEVRITGCKIKKMSKERLQTICNSGNYSTMTNKEAYDFASNISLSFIGVEQDYWPNSISEVCTRIYSEIWKSVTVKKVTYDAKHRISAVEFEVQLP